MNAFQSRAIFCFFLLVGFVGIVSAGPIAEFSADVTSGTAPLPVSFTDLSSNSPNGWAWYFGDETYMAPWTQVTTSAGWTERTGHSSVAMPDGSIVLMGGGVKNDVWRSMDNGKTWTQVTASAGWSARDRHSSVVMPDGSIVLMGGLYGAVKYNDVWRSTDNGATWTRMTASAGWSARYSHTSVAMPDGSIVLMGGDDSGVKNDVWRSTDNGATWTQVTANAGWSARNSSSSVVMPDGSIVLMGGQGAGSINKNDTWRSTDNGATWTQMTSSAGWTARDRHSSVVMPDGSIVLMGGRGAGSNRENDVWRSTDNGATWTQITASAGWTARDRHSSVVMPDGSIVLMGGFDNYAKNDVWRSEDNGATWTQVTANAGWTTRTGQSCVAMPDGSIVLMGGYDGTSTWRNDVWRSTDNGATWTQVTASAGWSERQYHRSVVMPDGSIVLMGGQGAGSINKNDTWRSTDNGATWTLMNASAGWTRRSFFSSVVMPDGSIVLMGGSGYKNDVWRSTDNGATWTQVTASAGWSARSAHSSVAMPDGSIVLMGGQGAGSINKNDTWRSTDNGATWTLMNASAGWSARSAHSSVAMPDGSIVLMGGSTATLKNDVWRSTDRGATWTQVNARAGWTARTLHSSVVLPDGSIVLIGGYDLGYKTDVWRFMPFGSSVQNPSHTYTTPGIYQVALQAYNAAGYNSTRKSGYITVTAPSPAPTVTAITPATGVNNGPISITNLAGTGFVNGATVKLTKAGQADIAATNVVWVSATKLTCNLPITGAATGTWDVVVTNPGPMTGTLTNGFTVTGSSAPIVDFMATPLSGAASLPVSFTDLSLNNPTGWAWFFGDEMFTAPWTQMTASAGWSVRENPSTVVMPDGSIVLMGGWGGGSQYKNDTWRSTDYGATWARVNASSGWSKRVAHSSVAMPDGSIVLMGGFEESAVAPYTITIKNDVWRSTDNGATWTQMTASAGWTRRYGHTSVVMPDGSIVLMGGLENNVGVYNDVWRSTDNGATWTQVTASAGWSPRAVHSSVVMPDGSIILMGGSTGTYRNDVWRSTDNGATWTEVTASAGWSARSTHSSVAMPDGSIVLMGGTIGYGLNDVWRSTDNGATWTQLPDAGWSARFGHNSVVMPDGSIVLMGGFNGGNDVWRFMPTGSLAQNPSHTYTTPGTYQVALQAYNPGGYNSTRKSGYITVTAPPPAPTVTAVTPATGVNNGPVTITDLAGTGFVNGATVKLTKAGQADIAATNVVWVSSTKLTCTLPITGAATGTWNVVVTNPDTQTGPLTRGFTVTAVPAPIASFTADATSGTSPLLVSFTDLSLHNPTGWAWFFGDESYTEAWTLMNASSGWTARSEQSSVVMPDGSIVLMGGSPGGAYFKNDTWRSSDKGATWTLMNASSGWSTRNRHSSVAMPDGSIVLMGGYDQNTGYKNDTWQSMDKGSTWTLMNASSGWTGRECFSSVAMPDGSIILMGGYDTGGNYKNDVWRSKDYGTTWTQVNASSGWLARWTHRSVAMPDGSIILMGGAYSDFTGQREMNDVWRSKDNGMTWTQMNASAGWSARHSFSCVAMPDGSIVLMGGLFSNDVWRSTNDGATWTKVNASAGWSARGEQSSVVMPDGSIVLMGGFPSGTYKNDTWRFMPAGSSAQNPSHTYTTPGTYQVALQAFNPGGYNSTLKTGYITVNSQKPVHNLNSGKDFTTIQAAINDAATSNGHTILVDSGIYHEAVSVNKRITLRGNDTGAGYPIVDADNVGRPFTLQSNGTILEQLTAINSSSSNPGIYVVSSHNIITHVNVSGNRMRGIDLFNSENNTITHVSGENNLQNIVNLYQSDNNRILNISSNWSEGGISVWYSKNNLIENITINNGTSIGIGIISSNNNIINNNLVTHYSEGIRLVYICEYNVVTNNNLRNNGQGISIQGGNPFVNHSFISNNTINNNNYGIWAYAGNGDTNNTITRNFIQANTQNGVMLFGSSFNISGNTITGNGVRGIEVHSSGSNNLIFDNFFENKQNVQVNSAQLNTWNTTKTAGTNIIGGSWLGGNYWAQPTGQGFSQINPDTDGDGISNAENNLAIGNIDRLPLTLNISINTPPVLNPIGPKSIDEGQQLHFTITASDPDGDTLTNSTSTLPTGATFDASTGTFTWTPGYDQAGSYPVTFTVSDGTLTDSEGITITVNNVNQAPVLDPIGVKSVDEGQQLHFTITASDPDGDTLTNSTSTLPTGATFDASTGTFTWTPGYNQAGSYPVTFTVSDATLTDSEDVTITVNNINRAPVLDAIGAKTGDEGQPIQFTVSATDPDGDALTYSTSTLPVGAAFETGSKTFIWTPGYAQAGSYPVTFTVSDGTLTDTEDVTTTVNDVNRAPVLNPIGSKSIDENQQIQFIVSASDPDGDTLTYSTSTLPAGATFDADTRTFTWTPGFDQAGPYTVIFTVSDGALTDSEDVTITVNNANRPPELAAIGDKSIAEGQTLTVTLSGTDPDGQSLTYSSSTPPSGATLTGATFTWTPGYEQAGTYLMTFTVSDGSLTDSEEVTITVTNVNRPPVLDTIGAKTGDEGQQLLFTVSASDLDGDTLIYSTSTLPTGAAFDAGTGTFTWILGYEQAGPYTVTFTVSDGTLTDSEEVTITVTNVNRAPELDAVGSKTVDEGQLLTFTVSATDPDNDALTYSTTGTLPAGATFDPIEKTFTWNPDYDQAGSYTVTFTVSDGSLTDSKDVTITVNNVNRAPVLDAVVPPSVNEGSPLTFTVTASDPDGDTLTYSTNTLPTGAAFDSTTKTFSWSPTYVQAGIYTVTITVSDGTLTDSEDAEITVNNVNRAPILDAIEPQSTDEGKSLTFTVSGTDPDGDALTYSTTGTLPAGATFDAGTRTFLWTPGFDQAGSYTVTFTVSDGTLTDTKDTAITVNNVNRAPIFDAIGAKTGNEGEKIEFAVSATDPDGDTLIYSTSAVPAGAVFDADTRTFTWTPGFDQAGSYTVTFSISDGTLADTEDISITVNNINRAPVLDAIGPKSTDEGQPFSFTINAADADGDTLTCSATGIPGWATFDTTTKTFSGTPGYTDAGSASVTFTVSDGTLTDLEEVYITVNNVNRAPILDAVVPYSVDEGTFLTFTVTASDPDGDTLTYSISTLPAGAAFDASTQKFTWTPGFDQAGSYTITFTVSDGTLTDSDDVPITVNNVNRAPVLDTIGTKTEDEGQQILFSVSATDPDGDPLTYSTTTLPAGAAFDMTTGTFTWTPGYEQAGPYTVIFTVSDGTLTDSEDVAITVNNVNRAPELDAIGSKTVDEDKLLTFTVSATDPDNDALTYSTTGTLPAGATFDPVEKTFIWTPNYDQAGSNTVTFTVSDGTLTDSKEVTITVNDVNRAPVLETIGAKTGDEGQQIQFMVSATDPDGDLLIYSTSSVPIGATFDADTRTFTWIPEFGQAGTHQVTFTVFDGTLTDSEEVTITVNKGNQPPVLDPIGSKSVDENQQLQFTISALDPDGDPLIYSINSVPTGAAFDAGTGTFTWIPGYEQAGPYTVTFTVSDGTLTDSEEVTITINNVNQIPVAEAGLDQAIQDIGTTVTLDGTQSYDEDGDILSYQWSFVSKPGGSMASLTGESTATPSFVFDVQGDYVIQLTVSDAESQSLPDTVTITPIEENRPPIAGFSISPDNPIRSDIITFTDSSSDPDGSVSSYIWNFGDGTTATLKNPTHQYATRGEYQVALTVTDDEGATGTVTRLLIVDTPGFDTYVLDIPGMTVSGTQLAIDMNVAGSIVSTLGNTITIDYNGLVLTIGTNGITSENGIIRGEITSIKASSDSITSNLPQLGAVHSSFEASLNALPSGAKIMSLLTSIPLNVQHAFKLVAMQNNMDITGMAYSMWLTKTNINDGSDIGAATVRMSVSSAWVAANGGPEKIKIMRYTDEGTTEILQPTWTVDGTGVYTFEVTSPNGLSIFGLVALESLVINQPPVLGPIGAKVTDEGVQLTFTVSAIDPEGDTLKFTAAGVPEDAVFDAGTQTFTWTPGFDRSGTYTVTFTVSDGLLTASEEVAITVNNVNRVPVADAGTDQLIQVIGTTVELDGTHSYDDDGDSLMFQWSFVSKPSGSTATIAGATTELPTFTADMHGDYIIRLVVSDPVSLSEPDTVTVSFANVKPVADAGTSLSIILGETAILDGTGSSDLNGDALSYQWSLTAAPPGSVAQISNPADDQPTFVPDIAGSYSIQLVVNDGIVNSDPVSIQIEVIAKTTKIISDIRNLEARISTLPGIAFKNPNMQNTLINKLNAVIAAIDAGDGTGALNKLQNDVQAKTDGCAQIGESDKNDWIITCEAQASVYPDIVSILNEVKGL